ncbi:MAG TPA: NADH:flavin oxidoreductase/NADH oxidase [Chthoniobacterales bacterium]|jgi:2,4-dienoyl-CoA reductase-like NADH-dependent reductase (Old Yellow Enzyme family)|nr:NADH:flavin oxidoreductase/NADH oxidase [Chthoniobacterales bacterium]
MEYSGASTPGRNRNGSTVAGLFTPLTIRGITFCNRIAVSPMCEYSSHDGFAQDWHLVHLGSRAVGGAGLVVAEASAVVPEGRITPADLGIWNDEHICKLAQIAAFLKRQGAVPGIQIAHAGRKASCRIPWEGGAPILGGEGGWQTFAPSAVPFRNGDPVPAELSTAQIRLIVDAFGAAARRALSAGFEVIEIHAAHGYLLHEFYSPLSNRRTDEYGGSFENRVRLTLEVAEAVRTIVPDSLPLFVRISSMDWKEDGWTIEDSVKLAERLRNCGADLIDCSSGGLVPDAKVNIGPAYQVPFAERIRREAKILTGAVGLITEPHQADQIIRSGQADIVLLAREMLRDPYWPLHAARTLKVELEPPVQYLRAFPEQE